MHKAEVIATIHRERAHLDGILASLSEDHMSVPALEGGRSVKDTLAHIAAWEQLCAGWFAAGLRGETPDIPANTQEEIDRLNEQVFQANRDRPLRDIQVESRRAYEQFLKQVEALSEDDLNNPRRFPWTEEETVIDFIAANSYAHYREHADQIQAWLAHDTMQA